MCEVSIIVPCFNEEETITLLLESIYNQTYPIEKMEVIIADGISCDKTREKIIWFRNNHSNLKVVIVDNYKRDIPSGLNLALENSSGEYIIRLDAHSIPSKEYISLSLERLKDGKGDVVGGMWEIKPGGKGWVSRSIASAASHPLGVGDAKYRVGGEAQKVDTVPFGAYSRRLIDEIGTYDEKLLSNEDYEFNVRVRQTGRVIWMDPKISSVYFARKSYKSLAKQYWRYGYWKVRMLIRYPSTFRWRQLAGLFVISWLLLGILWLWYPISGWLLLAEALIYGSALAYTGVHSSIKNNDLMQLIGVPFAIVVMHFSWGSAFLFSAIEYIILLGRNFTKSFGE